MWSKTVREQWFAMKSKLGIVGVAAAALVLTACSGSSGGGTAGDGEMVVDGHFTMGMYGDLGTLNPMLNISSSVREFTPIAYDRLLYYDENGEPHPWLAESWEDTVDSVTFVLKEGITCSDGTPFTASTAAANFAFVDDEENGSPLRGALVPAGVTTTADDETRTFTLNFDSPGSFLLYQAGTLDLLCQAALDDPTSIDAATNGTGMFVLTEALAGDRYEFERRDDYNWGYDDTAPDTPGVPKTVTIRMFNNESTLANSILNGEVNAGRVVGPDVERMDAASLSAIGSPMLQGQFWFNRTDGNATQDLAVRQALIQSIDLNDLAAVHTGGRGTVAESILSLQPRPCTYNSVGAVPAFDVNAATAALDSAGWVAGADGVRAKDGQRLEIGLVYDNSMDGVKAAAEMAEAQWSELGAAVTLLGGDDTYVIGTSLSEDRHLWQVSWVPIIADLPPTVMALASGPTAPDGTNLIGIDNDDYLQLTAEASALAGIDSCDTWQAAEETLIDDLSTVPYAILDDAIYFNGAQMAVDTSMVLGPAIRVVQ